MPDGVRSAERYAWWEAVERTQESSGSADVATLGARLKSGSPFRSLFFHLMAAPRYVIVNLFAGAR